MDESSNSALNERRYREIAANLLGSDEAASLFASPVGKKRFGAQALKYDGKIFAMLVRGRFVLKLPQARVDALVVEGAGIAFDAGKGRPMKQWVGITDGHESLWHPLASEAMAFAMSNLTDGK